MKRYILKIQLLLMVLALGTLASCSSEEELTGNTTTTLAAGQIEVGSFPAFGENSGTRASNIGTSDAGKTVWASGDVILLKAEVYPAFENNACTGEAITASTTTYTLTYDGSAWNLDNAIALSANSYQNGVKFTAYYAPSYEWSNGTLALKDGKTAGTDEYLTTTSQYAYSALSTTTPSISFTDASRNYSRLRVATEANSIITLTASVFTPAGTTATLGGSTLSTTADAKGNAYFYGTWTASSSASVKSDVKITYGVYKNDFTLPEAYTAKSYAIAGLAKWGFDSSCYHSWDAASLPEDCPTAKQMISYLEAGYYWDDAETVLDGQQTFSTEKDGVDKGTFHTGLWLLKKENIVDFENVDATLPYENTGSKKPTLLSTLTADVVKEIRTSGKYFFLPAAGADNKGLWGTNCIYWSKTEDTDKYSYAMYVTSSYAKVGSYMKTNKQLTMIAE